MTEIYDPNVDRPLTRPSLSIAELPVINAGANFVRPMGRSAAIEEHRTDLDESGGAMCAGIIFMAGSAARAGLT